MKLTSKNLDFTAIHLPTLYDYRASKGTIIHVYCGSHESLYVHFPMRKHIHFPKTSINLTFYQLNPSTLWFIFLLCIPLEWDCKARFPFNNIFFSQMYSYYLWGFMGQRKNHSSSWFSNSLDACFIIESFILGVNCEIASQLDLHTRK